MILKNIELKILQICGIGMTWLIMDNDNGEIVDKIEAINRIKEGSSIEIGY